MNQFERPTCVQQELPNAQSWTQSVDQDRSSKAELQLNPPSGADAENMVPLMRDVSEDGVPVPEGMDCSRVFYSPLYALLVAMFLLFGTVAAFGMARTKQNRVPKCVQEITGGISWEQYMENARMLNETNRCRADDLSTCYCMDYTKPQFPEWDSRRDKWINTFQQHLEQIEQYADSGSPALDIVMLGDSITEHWLGTVLGQPSTDFEDIFPVYQEMFRPENGSDISGIPFAISGDQCANLLYRVEKYLMHDALQPAVWWILIGTNDVGWEFCKDEIVISGIIYVAELIQKRRPNATIIINSLLPRGKVSQLEFWEQLSNVNHALACYVKGKDHRIQFFNATSLFLLRDGLTLNGSLFVSDGIHPNAVGSAVWGKAIVQKVKELLQAQ